MIISQEMQTSNKNKLASVGGSQAHRFLNDPKLNEHKIIGEKFKRKTYKSMAVDLYQKKLQNNPMRYESGMGNAANKENMPTIYSKQMLNGRYEPKTKLSITNLPRLDE